MDKRQHWDAFISYTQEPDRAIARALRDGIQTFGKTAFALRRARIFLDKTALAASADLPRSLQNALTSCQKLIVLCSPESARSAWVNREVQIFIDARGAENVLLVQTGGRLEWANRAFVPETTNALPEALLDAFPAEPLWVDLAWARSHADFRRAPEMRAATAQLAAAVLGLPLDELEGDDVRGQRLLRRLRMAAVLGLVALTAASAGLAIWAEGNRRVAVERSLSMSARAAAMGDPSLANAQTAAAFALSANRTSRTPETWDAAAKALDSLPTAIIWRETGVTAAAFAPSRSDFAIASGNAVSGHDASGTESWNVGLDQPVIGLAWSPSARRIAVLDKSSRLTLLSADGKALNKPLSVPSPGIGEARASSPSIWFITDDLVAVALNGDLHVVDLKTGSSEKMAENVDRLLRCGDAVSWTRVDGAVLIAGLAPRKEPRVVHRHKAKVSFMACADDGGSLASVSESDEALWTRNKLTSSHQFHGVSAMVLAPSGDLLAVNTSMILQTGRLDTRNARNETLLFAGKLAQYPAWRSEKPHPSKVVAFHGEALLTVEDKVSLLRLDARDPAQSDRAPISDQVDHLVGLSPPDEALAVTTDREVLAINFETGARRNLGRTTGWATGMIINDGRTAVLLLSMIDGADIHDQRRTATLIAPGLAPGAVILDSVRATAGARTGAFTLRALSQSRTRVSVTSPHPYRSARAFDLGGDYGSLEVSEEESRALLWGEDGVAITDLDGRTIWRDPLWTSMPALAANGKIAILHNEAPMLVSMETGVPVPLPFEIGSPGSLKVSNDVGFAAVVLDQKHQLWDLRKKHLAYESAANDSWSSAFSEDGSTYIASTADRFLDVVSLREKLRSRRINVPLTVDGELKFSESAKWVFVPAREAVARVTIATGVVETLQAPGGPSSVVVAPEDNGLIVGYPDGGVLIFDRGMERIGQFRLSGTMYSAVFSKHGDFAAILSGKGGVRLVDMKEGQQFADVRADMGTMANVALTDDDRWMLVEGGSHAWIVPIDPYTPLCLRAVRSLSDEEWKAIGGLASAPTLCDGRLGTTGAGQVR